MRPDTVSSFRTLICALSWRHPVNTNSSVASAVIPARRRGTREALRGEAAHVADLIRNGARVMVCGGRDMAAGVADALAEILAPTGLTPAVLKAEGRYVEDVY